MARPRSKMTDKWQNVLSFIKAYRNVYGTSPSYSSIAKGVGLKSRSNMHRMVKRLEEEGHLEIRPGKIYGVRVVDRSVREVASL